MLAQLVTAAFEEAATATSQPAQERPRGGVSFRERFSGQARDQQIADRKKWTGPPSFALGRTGPLAREKTSHCCTVLPVAVSQLTVACLSLFKICVTTSRNKLEQNALA